MSEVISLLIIIHIILAPKYRKPLFHPPIDDYMQELIENICSTNQWVLYTSEIRSDHIHLFLSALPSLAPGQIVSRLKSLTARKFFQEFPEIRQTELWGGHLWPRGYYVGSAGHVSSQTIQNYIKRQDHT